MMYNCNSPNVPIGAVVILDRFPDTRWLVCNGWYVHDGVQQNGTYLKSIPAGTVIPMTADDAVHMTIVSGGSCHPHNHPCNPCHPPHHPHNPSPPPMQRPIEDYLPGVNYVEGQLVWLTAGDVYQVSTNFTSCSEYTSAYENLMKDVELGNLIPIGNSESGDPLDIGRIPEGAIDDMFD